MAIPVKLTDIVGELDAQSQETVSFLNVRTGEIETVGDMDHLFDDEDDRPSVEELEESRDWVALPTKFDIHDWDIMRRFAEAQASPARETLLEALHGAGALRFFRASAERQRLLDAWHLFRDGEYERIAVSWLEEHAIPYVR